MPAKKATKTDNAKAEHKAEQPARPQTGTPQEFLVKGAPVKTAEAKAKDKNKGKEPWRHKLISGSSHPDHKPPVTIIAQASDDAKKKYEDSINAEREKVFGTAAHPDWRDLEGGSPPEEDDDKEEPQFPKGAADARN